MDLNLEDFHYVLTQTASNHHVGPFEIFAYDFWRKSWDRALTELGEKDFLPSDHYLIQDEISTIYHKDFPIAQLAFKWINFTWPGTKDLSYIRSYHPEAIEYILNFPEIKQVMSWRFLAIEKDYRKGINSGGIPFADVIVALAVERFFANPESHVAIASTRVNRKVDELVMKYGLRQISPSIQVHGIETGHFAAPRSEVRPHFDSTINKVVQALWQKKTVRLNPNHNGLTNLNKKLFKNLGQFDAVWPE